MSEFIKITLLELKAFVCLLLSRICQKTNTVYIPTSIFIGIDKSGCVKYLSVSLIVLGRRRINDVCKEKCQIRKVWERDKLKCWQKSFITQRVVYVCQVLDTFERFKRAIILVRHSTTLLPVTRNQCENLPASTYEFVTVWICSNWYQALLKP